MHPQFIDSSDSEPEERIEDSVHDAEPDTGFDGNLRGSDDVVVPNVEQGMSLSVHTGHGHLIVWTTNSR